MRIFLCHCSADKAAVRELYSRLKESGFAPWLDEQDILPGEDWDAAIRQAVRSSEVVVICLSHSATTKGGYLQREIRLALDTAEEKLPDTIFLIPAKLEQCDVPQHLRRWQWVDLFTPSGYDRLVAALQKKVGQRTSPRVSTPVVTPPDGIPATAGTAQEWALSTDDTEFASQLASIIKGALGDTVTPYSPFNQSSNLIVVRGNKFFPGGDEEVFMRAHLCLAKGGIVLFTAFTSWELFTTPKAAILPFAHVGQKFFENTLVTVTAQEGTPLRPLTPEGLHVANSYELLRPKAESEVLLWQDGKVPLLGSLKVHDGISIYLNACQHACDVAMASPFTKQPALQTLVAAGISLIVTKHRKAADHASRNR